MKKLLSVVLAVALMAALLLPMYAQTTDTSACASTSDGFQDLTDEKRYSTATLNDEFAEDCVLLVLNRENSIINKVHTSKSFREVENIRAVEDLT